MKLNIGSGYLKKEGFKTVDCRKEVNPDYLTDLEEKDCLKEILDNTVDEIIISKVLEHIRNLEQLMKEIYRVCQNGAKVIIVVPYWTSIRAFNDPGHIRFFTENSMVYFNKDCKGSDGRTFQTDYDFKTVSINFEAEEEYKDFSVEEITKAARKYLNVISLITFTLEVKK